MRYRLSDHIWLEAATKIEGPEKHLKLEGLVRFLARRAAEVDFAEEADLREWSEDNDLEKDL